MVVISGNQRPDGRERRSPASLGAALERRSLSLLWKRRLEPWWYGSPGDLVLHEFFPVDTNRTESSTFQVEIGRFVPGMHGTLTVPYETGEEVDSKSLQLNRGELYPYAHASLAASATYTLMAKMQPPAFLGNRTEGRKAGYSLNRLRCSSRTQTQTPKESG
jgi:hypothetical protein